MKKEILYTETFDYTFNHLVEFLRHNWGDRVVTEFIDEAEKTIQLIVNFPNMYKPSAFHSSVRVAPIKKLSSLFYEVNENHLTLLYIVDTRQEPFWL